jgi:hypothetical protein
MRVHSATGPGLLESAYEYCLDHLLRSSGMRVERQLALRIYPEEERIEGVSDRPPGGGDGGCRSKAVEKLMPIHVAQMATCLRLGKYPLGFLLSFNVRHMRQGIKRVVL